MLLLVPVTSYVGEALVLTVPWTGGVPSTVVEDTWHKPVESFELKPMELSQRTHRRAQMHRASLGERRVGRPLSGTVTPSVARGTQEGNG